MTNHKKKWLLLIHQIPPKPNALRVKIWRRLQQVGAVAIKQSVYAIPLSEEFHEDLSWILKEITEGGGDGSIIEAQFVEGLNDKAIVDLFITARMSDYEKIIHDAKYLIKEWSTGQFNPKDPALKGQSQVNKLQQRIDKVIAIDFFGGPEQEIAKTLISDLNACLSGRMSSTLDIQNNSNVFKGLNNLKNLSILKGKTWVTRKNLFVDRLACGWFIHRFIDDKALFKFIDQGEYTPKEGELRFDMFEGEFTHRGEQCTFEVMVQDLNLKDPALYLLAQIIHDIDLKDTKYGHSVTTGFYALIKGLVTVELDDNNRMTSGFQLFENLYSYFEQLKE